MSYRKQDGKLHFVVQAFVLATWATFACQIVAQENKAEVERFLIDAIDSYENDEAFQKLDSRSKYYLFLREGIQQSPVLRASQLLAEIGSDRTLEMAIKVDDPAWRIFNLTNILTTESKNQRDAEPTIKKTFELYKELDAPEEAKSQLIGHLFVAILKIDKNEKKAKQRFVKHGISLDGFDDETMKIEMAKYFVSINKIDAARELLTSLPERTFQQRRFNSLMQQNKGAAALAMSGQPDSDYTANHVLIEWLDGNEQTEAKLKLVQELDDDDLGKLGCFIMLAQHFDKQGNRDKAIELLGKAEACAEHHEDPRLEKALKIQFAIERAKLANASIADSLEKASLLNPEDVDLKNAVIDALFEAGETDAANKLVEGSDINDSVRFKIVASYLKNDEVENALKIASEAESPLAGPSMIGMIADHQWKKDRPDKAREMITRAITAADKVPSTNQWSPPEGMVSLDAKWQISAMLFRSAIKMDLDQKTFDLFPRTTVPFFQVGFALGSNGKLEILEDWIKSVEGKPGFEGVRSLATLGLARGYANYKKGD